MMNFFFESVNACWSTFMKVRHLIRVSKPIRYLRRLQPLAKPRIKCSRVSICRRKV